MSSTEASRADPIRASAILRVWERASGLEKNARSLLLASDPLTNEDDTANERAERLTAVAHEPIGRQHARLLHLRAAAFGPDLDATTTCPRCGERVEFGLDATELAAAGTPAPVAPIECDGIRVEWRSPSPADVAAATEASELGDDPERELLRRCVLSAVAADGGPISADVLPERVRARLAHAMSEADPLAEVLLDTACPSCRAVLRTEIDVAEFVWTEIEARARRVLLDVDILARAYGWTERDVLALTEPRRAAYLRLVTQGLP